MKSTTCLEIVHTTNGITTFSNPNLTQLQILIQTLFKSSIKPMPNQPFVTHTHHHITSHVIILSLDLCQMLRKSPCCPSMIPKRPQALPESSPKPQKHMKTILNTRAASKHIQKLMEYLYICSPAPKDHGQSSNVLASSTLQSIDQINTKSTFCQTHIII